jgi:hypothetical protein
METTKTTVQPVLAEVRNQSPPKTKQTVKLYTATLRMVLVTSHDTANGGRRSLCRGNYLVAA